jgi:hypothetical protein
MCFLRNFRNYRCFLHIRRYLPPKRREGVRSSTRDRGEREGARGEKREKGGEREGRGRGEGGEREGRGRADVG